MAETTQPVLDLHSIANRPTVAIDGTAYPMRAEDDFSIFQIQQQHRELPRLSELLNGDRDLTSDEEIEMERLLDRFCRRVFAAPSTVHEKLTNGQRIQITNLFFTYPGLKAAKPGAATSDSTAATVTGATSSPSSSPSTAGIH